MNRHLSSGTRARCAKVAASCTAIRLRAAARSVNAMFEEVMQEAGVSGPQFSLLVGLAVAGEVPLGRLAEVLDLDRTTLTRNLDVLERRRLVVSGPGPDRRNRLPRLSAAGIAALERALPLWEVAQRRCIEGLGRSRWTALMATLRDTRAVARRS